MKWKENNQCFVFVVSLAEVTLSCRDGPTLMSCLLFPSAADENTQNNHGDDEHHQRYRDQDDDGIQSFLYSWVGGWPWILRLFRVGAVWSTEAGPQLLVNMSFSCCSDALTP